MTAIRTPIENYPNYYHVAYGVDRYKETGQYSLKVECDFIEYAFKTYAQRKVNSILEIACGPAYHAIELGRRGFNVASLDISRKMLDFASKRADKSHVQLRTYRRNMAGFRLDSKFDAALNVLDSLRLLLTKEKLINHLVSMGRIIRPGGIYFVEVAHPADQLGEKRRTTPKWSSHDGEVTMSVRMGEPKLNLESGVSRMPFEYTIHDSGRVFRIVDVIQSRIILQQDLVSLTRSEGSFTLLKLFGAYEKRCEPESERAWRIIAILRR